MNIFRKTAWGEFSKRSTGSSRDQKIWIILNPSAGMARSSHPRRMIERILNEKGISFQIYEINQLDRIKDIVCGAVKKDFTCIVAAGGDGTVSQVADGIAGTGIPMGILPVGTGNIIAKDLGIPMKLSEALKLIVAQPHELTYLDAMKVADRNFFLNVSAGFSANIFIHTDAREKKRFGIFSYIWRGLLQLAGIQPMRFTLVVDGKKIRVSASDVLVANSALIGWKQLKLDPSVRMDDGLLSVCILRARNLVDFIRIAWHLLLRKHKLERKLRWIHINQWVEIQTARPIAFQGDGDVIGVTPFRVDFVPGAVPCIVPTRHTRKRIT